MDTTKWLKTILVCNIILIKILIVKDIKNEDIGHNESIVPDSDPDSSDIEVSSVRFLVIKLILGKNWMIMDLTPLMMLL